MTEQTTRQATAQSGEPILDLPTAVREMGALPMPAGNERQALSAERLADIAAREDAATPGPWCTDDWEIYQGAEYEPGISMWIGETCRGTTTLDQDRADATFVAHAREDVPALLAEIRYLKADREESDREYEAATARIAELESERHTTNEALSDAAEQLRRQRDRIAVLEKAAVEGRAALAAFCHDLEDPGSNAFGALYLLQQATFGTPMQPGETVPKVYRAWHDVIPMGLYLTREAAQQHCEASARASISGDVSLDWDEDETEEDGVSELVVTRIDGSEYSSGYVVTPLEVAAEYNAEAEDA